MKKENEVKDSPIRIAHIVGKWVGGGVESVVMNYYKHIDHKKIQFDFICDEDSSNIPYEEIELLGGKVILIPPYQKVIKYQKELQKVLKEGKYKIVHSHINALSVFPLYAAKKLGIPVRIAHSHSTTNKSEWVKNLLKQVLRRFSKFYATEFFACTEHAGRWLFGNKTFEQGKVFIVNNAIDLDKFKYNEEIRELKRKELGIDNKTLVISHIGRFVKQKNHDYIIDIFYEVYKKNSKVVLILVGQGPLEDKIKDKVNKLGLDKVVLFLGQRDDVNEMYQAFDIFLFPSLYEGLGIALIEAQCAGCYCLASTEVPIIAKVTENVEFIKLKNSYKVWRDLILNYKIEERKNLYKTISEAGFNIKNEVKILEEKYLDYNKQELS